jgi:signal transduction histidine kinase
MVASGHRLAGVRVRTTLAATLVVALVLAVGGFGFVLLQQDRLHDALADLAVAQADDLSRQVSTLGLTSRELVTLVHGEDGVVQVLDGQGNVVAASDPIEESGPIVTARPAPGETASVDVGSLPEEHDNDYVVVARGVSTPDGDAVVMVAQTLESVDRSTDVVTRLLVIGLPIVVLLVGLISYWLTGRALAPVDQMRLRVGEITARDLSARVPVSPAGDEISRLAETMNAMLERLQTASSRQRRFVADASHELRSPLSVIRTSQEIGLAHPESTDWPQTGVDTLAELERLERLVSDLLLLARFDDNDPGAAYTEVDLDDIVGAEAVRLRRLGACTVNAEIDPVRVLGDPHQLSRLVRNLVDNATGHARSTVGLRVYDEGGRAVIEVSDDGPGIPPEDGDRIFERFVRLDESRGRDTGGTGLGLSIVREIARRHGGDVSLAGAPKPGGRTYLTGARFVVRLPMPGPAMADPSHRPRLLV